MNRTAVLSALGIAVAGAGGWAYWDHVTRLPDCSNEGTVALLQGMVRMELAGTNEPKLLEHFNELVKVDINAIETLSYTKEPERYTCEAQVSVDLGTEVQSTLGIKQEMLDNPNLVTAMIIAPALQEVYGPLEGLRVKYTSTWAKEKGETKHYVTARLSNPGATGYATLTEMAWAQQQRDKQNVAKSAAQAPVKKEEALQVQPAPKQTDTTQGSTQSASEVQSQKLSASWLAAMSKAETGNEIAALYAPRVSFYGKAGVSLEEIAREKSAFIRRWPQRNYQSNGPAQITGNTPNQIEWTQSFTFEVSDGIKSRSGQAKLSFTAEKINGAWLIVAESKVQ